MNPATIKAICTALQKHRQWILPTEQQELEALVQRLQTPERRQLAIRQKLQEIETAKQQGHIVYYTEPDIDRLVQEIDWEQQRIRCRSVSDDSEPRTQKDVWVWDGTVWTQEIRHGLAIDPLTNEPYMQTIPYIWPRAQVMRSQFTETYLMNFQDIQPGSFVVLPLLPKEPVADK